MSHPETVPDQPLTTPLDSDSLRLLREATRTSKTHADDGSLVNVNGDFTVNELLDFWSGTDRTTDKFLGVMPDPITGTQDVEWYEATKPCLHAHDVISDLVSEILRLRGEERV